MIFDRTLPFPPPLTPGEFGRAWLDSLWANDRALYRKLEQEGHLQATAQQMEDDGQDAMVAMLTQQDSRPIPPGMTPLAYQTQRELAAREQVMAMLRVPEPDPE